MRAVVLAIIAALTTGKLANSAPRVVSLDQCADQYVLVLSDRAHIAGLSARALADDSLLRDSAKGLPILRADTESILAARPEVIVRYWGGAPGMLDYFRRRGVRVVTLDDASDFTGVRANIRRVARTLDAPALGETLIRDMDAKLAASAGAWREAKALYLSSGGDTAGRGTLINAMLSAAGLNNGVQAPGFSEVSLETLTAKPPSAIVAGFFDPAVVARQPWGIGRTQALRRLMARRTLVSLPAALLGCPAWFAADAVVRIADAAPARRGKASR